MLILYSFFTNYAPLIAKENLNKKIKNIAKSVVILYAYDGKGRQIAEESGFFISKDGDVITNREVLIGAIDAYKQVLRINPKDAEANNFLGISYLNLSRYTFLLIALARRRTNSHCSMIVRFVVSSSMASSAFFKGLISRELSYSSRLAMD